MYGSDAANSMEPEEFKKFCNALKETAVMRDSKIDKNDLSQYIEMKKYLKKVS